MTGDHLEVRAEDFRAAARTLTAAGDKDLKREVTRALRDVVRPFAQQIVAEGAAVLPRRGGLAGRVAAARIGQTTAMGGANPRVSVNLSTREGYDLRRMDEGTVWHKVWGRPPWIRQSVPAGGFSEAFSRGAPEVAEQVVSALEAVTRKIGRAT